jgi:2-C-methyl-D-erythritol 4-phosphate cytidylyltransferase
LTPIDRYWLAMPAAGSGRRFGGELPKQYCEIAGATLIEHALRPFQQDPRCAGFAIAAVADDPWWQQVKQRWPSQAHPPIEASGGAERCDSVANALAALAAAGCADGDWVLVHDAARPCVTAAEIERLLGACGTHADGALLAVPLADTLKRNAEDTTVAATVPRSGLWRALTPQMFRRGRLQRALEAARTATRVPTDEAEAVEWAGGRVLLVAGEASNLKVTTADDLVLARAILAQRNLGAKS